MLPVLGKKAVLEWCMEEGLIGSSYVCPKCGTSMGKKERNAFPNLMCMLNVFYRTIAGTSFERDLANGKASDENDIGISDSIHGKPMCIYPVFRKY
ncbi:hypothetical protein TNCV_4878541 [Trichonephila clavipes]|nr:hypothetical protein TNCV_4878541 [Trichonephila clavipes]